MSRLLVTGASGFIGRNCLEAAIPSGAFAEIHAVGRRGGVPGTDVAWHVADLRDPRQAEELVRKVKPSHLLHCAWIATPGVYLRSPENMDWLAASQAMARAFGEHGGRRFVGVGSSAEYAPEHGPCVEDATPIRPVTIYARCKAACWQAVRAAAQHHGFSAAWGRVFLPYGPGDARERLIPSLVRALRAGQPIETTQGHQLRDFVFVTDIAALLVHMLGSSESGAFNIGTGHGVPVRDVIRTLTAKLGASPDLLRFGARPMAEGEPMELVADMEKVRRSFGWSAATGIEAGLDWVVAHTA